MPHFIWEYLDSATGDESAKQANYAALDAVRLRPAILRGLPEPDLSTELLGHRYALPNSTIHMHQPLGGAQGQATDIEIQAKQILRLKALLLGILAKHTGQPLEVIERDSDRDYYLEAKNAVEYGLVDQVLEVPEKVK